jgi:AcrR family transcriptional regulator
MTIACGRRISGFSKCAYPNTPSPYSDNDFEKHAAALPAGVAQGIDRCLAEVRKVWPNLSLGKLQLKRRATRIWYDYQMQVRERILEAALKLLAEGGVHELTQPKVARAAGVRQSHLTYYFPTRGELLQEVARYSIEKLAGQLARSKKTSLAEGIAAGAADKRRSRVMLGLVTSADRDPAIKKRMRKFVGELRARMTPVLAAGGLETDPASVAFFHSVIVGCAVLQLARDNAEARAEARAVLKKAVASIAKGGA